MTGQAGFAANVMTLGTGPRRALALHCTMAFGGAWSGVAKAAPHLTLVAPDMPSHGRSPDWDRQSSFADTVYAASLAAMDDTPMDVIGHSFGAAAALMLATRHPERIRSLALFEPVFFAIAQADAPETVAEQNAASADYAAAAAAEDWSNAARIFNASWGAGATAWEDLPDRTRAAMTRAVPVVGGSGTFLYDDSAGIMPRLGDIDIPTAVMRGAQAQPIMEATVAGLADRIPDAALIIMEGAGHMAPITHPQAFVAAIAPLYADS